MAQLHFCPGQMRFMSRAAPRRLRAALLLGLAAAVTACGDRRDGTVATRDSALDRDLTLAASATPTVAIGDTAVTNSAAAMPLPNPAPATPPAPTPVSTPAPRATPSPVSRPARRVSTPAPSPAPAPTPSPAANTPSASPAAAPAETPAAAAGRSPSLGAGMVLTGPTNAAICSLAQRPGDRFVVSLGRDVSGTDGATLTAGTPVLVELARVDSTTGEFAFRLRGVQVNGEFVPAEGTVRVAEGQVTERKVSKGGSDQGKVITGAIIGGILGRVIGGGTRGAVIGAAGGAAAGTVAAARNNTTERCLAAGATLSATLTAPLALPPAP